MPVDILRVVIGVANTQPGAKGIATNEPMFDPKRGADVFELFAIMRGGIKMSIFRCWRFAVAPKVYGYRLAHLA